MSNHCVLKTTKKHYIYLKGTHLLAKIPNNLKPTKYQELHNIIFLKDIHDLLIEYFKNFISQVSLTFQNFLNKALNLLLFFKRFDHIHILLSTYRSGKIFHNELTTVSSILFTERSIIIEF